MTFNANGSSYPGEEERKFKLLFDTYFDRVYDFSNYFSKSDYIAEEVTQQLFVILWRKRNDLDTVLNLDQYIFRIARNLAVNLLKKAATDDRIASEFYHQSAKQQAEILDKVNYNEVQRLIDEAVTALPTQPRKIYLMSRRENMSYDEMAAATGLSRNTVKNHLQRALNDIREYLILHNYQPLIIVLLLKMLR